jgi:hypothetical protein
MIQPGEDLSQTISDVDRSDLDVMSIGQHMTGGREQEIVHQDIEGEVKI